MELKGNLELLFYAIQDPGMKAPLIIGESKAIKEVISTAKKLAESNTITTLIIGENITGISAFE